MQEAIVPEELAIRVRELVERYDGGDVARAAIRIGAREADLRSILDAEARQPSVAVLSAIVRGYDVDTWWLISGETTAGSTLPADRRGETPPLLSAFWTTLTLPRRLFRGGTGAGVHTHDAAPRESTKSTRRLLC